MRCPSFFLNESKLIHHRILLLSIKMQMQVNTIQSTCLFVLKVTQIIVLQTSSSSENLNVLITQKEDFAIIFVLEINWFLHNLLIFRRNYWLPKTIVCDWNFYFLGGQRRAPRYKSLIKKYSGYKRTLYQEGEPITCMSGLNMPEHAIHLSFWQ